MLKPKFVITVGRDSILEFKAQGMSKLFIGLLTTAKITDRRIKAQFSKYLVSQEGLIPGNDRSVLAWLQEHPGPMIAAILFKDDKKKGHIAFVVTAGTKEELKKFGGQHV